MRMFPQLLLFALPVLGFLPSTSSIKFRLGPPDKNTAPGGGPPDGTPLGTGTGGDPLNAGGDGRIPEAPTLEAGAAALEALLAKEFEVPDMLFTAFNKIKGILLYKPPVGIVTIYTISKLISSGRLFRRDIVNESEKALADASKNKRDRRRHRGRAFDLDKEDTGYQSFGGVERVRRRLCFEGLTGVLENHETIQESGGLFGEHKPNKRHVPIPQCANQEARDLVSAVVDVLSETYHPGGSKTAYVQSMLEPMARLEKARMALKKSGKRAGQGTNDLDKVLEVAAMTAEIRVLDGLLRMARDRLLRTSYRLKGTRNHWKKRVKNAQSSRNILLQYFFKDSINGDRSRLAFADAAYKSEVTRLGKVVDVMMNLPEALPDQLLTEAVQITVELNAVSAAQEEAERNLENQQAKNKSGAGTRPFGSTWKLPDLSKYALRFNAEGKGRLAFHSYDDDLTIGSQGAIETLLAQRGNDEWLSDASKWCDKARVTICDYIEDSLENSVQGVNQLRDELDDLDHTWCSRSFKDEAEVDRNWSFVFEMVRDITSLRRVGEGRTIRWKDSNFIHWFRQFDLLGIPSVVLKIWLAHIVHNQMIVYWPKIRDQTMAALAITWDVFQRKFWIPFRDIIYDILNRGQKGMMDGLSVADEELSLDNMLKDMGFGDGTPEDRQQALNKALRQYEHDMDTGLIRHAIGGRLVRLILIQIQQLKVGSLGAMESIEVLLKANKLNVQLLGFIPAVLAITIGTRLFIKFLYNLRSKDLRPIGVVHSEMTNYLHELESIMLLADQDEDKRKPAQNLLEDDQLGEFTLTMYNYLVLLDYANPPFPSWQCDSIHRSMQEFLGATGSFKRLSINDQIRMIDQIKRKHMELAKHL